MTIPTLVNGQVTDSVTQTVVGVVAESPAQALGALYQVSSHANGLALQNAVNGQQALGQLTAAISSKGAQLIMELGGNSEQTPPPLPVVSEEEKKEADKQALEKSIQDILKKLNIKPGSGSQEQ